MNPDPPEPVSENINTENNEKTRTVVVPRLKPYKKIIKNSELDIIINPEAQIGLDCTADIVKNTKLLQPSIQVLPFDLDQMFYIPMIQNIAPELESFYLSHIKIQRLKNLFREEEKEPVILSNIINERPDNPIHNIVEVVETVEEVIEDSLPKVEKNDEKNDETWSSRTLKLLKLLKIRLANQKTLYFEELSKKGDRRVMACGFYELLQLCLKDFIFMDDDKGRILLKATDRLLRMTLL